MTSAPQRQHPRFAGQIAERWLKDEGFNALPIRPQLIADRLGIIVQAKPDAAPGVSGMLLRNGNSFGILYATHIPSSGFQNFSIAHELGHYLLAGHPEHLFADGVNVHLSHAGFVTADPIELEADHFAAGLLMPDPLFTTAMRRFGDGLEAIEALAALCETSLTATAIRYAQRTSAPAAVILSTCGRIDYCFMSTAMQEFDDLQWPRRGEMLPGGTATDMFASNQRYVAEGRREQTTSDLRQWLSGSRNVEVIEEIVGLGAYGKVLTVLTADTFADEDLDDDEFVEDRWTPRF